PSPPDRGAVLYARHCAACHGEDGSSDTIAADLLRPRPTQLRHGLFKLVSTTNGVPSEDDLVATLRRGMPGSTMMSWGWLPESDLRDLAREVRRLAIRPFAASLVRSAAMQQLPITPEQALARAERTFEPGPAIELGAGATEGDPAAGRELFLRHCAICHGEDARGLPALRAWPETYEPWWSRDLTHGALRGGDSARELALRIRTGMPGAYMPPTPLSDEQLGALVAYLRQILPAENERHLQARRTLRAVRVARLPADDVAQPLAELEPTRLPVVPLWWRPEATDEVWLRVAHDGQELLLRLDWADASRDDRVNPDRAIGDGAAVQFTREHDPPLFAMGTAAQAVNMWCWRSYGPHETAGMLDLLERRHVGLDVPRADWRPAPRMESTEFHGVASARTETGSGLPLHVRTQWRDGRWTVAFRRSLRARSEHEVDFERAGPVLFALAIWDSRVDRHAGSKAITTWHVLELER
ncbi:MAG TPA: c-type cytochrome, partial [Planctomycetota bacterium]|nr:c-type cytochrome [Planctomycetota bacterium]